MQRYSRAPISALRNVAASALAGMTVLSMITSAFLPSVAHAAAGEGTATIAVGTGGTSASDATYGSAGASGSITVGTLSYMHFALTVGASGIAANQANVSMAMPLHLFPVNGWDTAPEATLGAVNAVGEWFVGYTDTDSATTNNAAISFAASSATNGGVISVEANQNMDSTDVLRVYVAVSATRSSTVAGVTLQTDDVGENSLVSIGTLPQLTVNAADAAATVTLGNNAYVGATGTTTLSLTVPFALEADDTIEITFPASINVSGVGAAVTGTFEATDSITCAAAGQVVTCTTSAATNATGTIIMTGIRAAYAATTDVTSVAVEFSGINDANIATDSTVAMTDTRVHDSEETSSGTVALTYDIDVTVPSAADAYMPGDIMDITWNNGSGTGTAGFVSLYYSLDGGETLVAIATNTVNDSSYMWTVPSITASDVVIVAHATDLLDVLATAESDAFSINVDDTIVEEEEDVVDESEETMDDGTFIRGESWSTVYYVHNGMRHPFLDSQTFFTYADDFSDVVTVSDDELANYTIGTPMLPMAGTVLVKIQSVNKVYALEAGNTLRWITSEALATSLYGSAWADYVIDVPVTAWGHFTMGEDIDSTADITVNTSLLQTRNALNSK